MRRPSSACAAILLAGSSILVCGQTGPCSPAPPDSNTNQNGDDDSTGTDDTTNGDDLVSDDTADAIETDVAAAEITADDLADLIDNGSTPESALKAIKTTLEADSAVNEARMGSDNTSLWVRYESGLHHVFAVVDQEEEDTALDNNPTFTTSHINMPGERIALGVASGPVSRKLPVLTSQLLTEPTWEMPAGSKALVANSLAVSQPLQDTTQQVETMLKDRGYAVTRSDLTLDLFKRLTDFAVIYIEAHGKVDPLSFVSPCTDIEGNTMTLATTTPWTTGPEGNLRTYMKDVVCGRLRTGALVVRRPGQDAYVSTAFWVSPDFVRKYATGRFPRYTLLCLSACRGYTSANYESEWQDLLHEKCDAGFFVGWTNRVHYALSARAYLNLFQMMTGSNEKFSLTSAQSGKTYYLLEEFKPPIPLTDLATATQGLTDAGYDSDPLTGAQLTWTWPPPAADGSWAIWPLILAPDIRTFVFQPQEAKNLTTEATVIARCLDNATLHVGDTSVNMGTQNMGFYFPRLPLGASGEMYLEQDGRTGPKRDLMRWSPVFKVKGTGANNMTYEITFLVQARAIAGSTPERQGAAVWNTSTASFSAAIDPQASVVTWSVTGSGVDGKTRYDFSGGSSEKLSPVSDIFESNDGATASITVISDVLLEYTVTATNLDDNSVSTWTSSLDGGFWNDSLALNSNWGISSGSQTYGGSSRPGTLTWSSFGPTPAYDPDTSRR